MLSRNKEKKPENLKPVKNLHSTTHKNKVYFLLHTLKFNDLRPQRFVALWFLKKSCKKLVQRQLARTKHSSVSICSPHVESEWGGTGRVGTGLKYSISSETNLIREQYPIEKETKGKPLLSRRQTARWQMYKCNGNKPRQLASWRSIWVPIAPPFHNCICCFSGHFDKISSQTT